MLHPPVTAHVPTGVKSDSLKVGIQVAESIPKLSSGVHVADNETLHSVLGSVANVAHDKLEKLQEPENKSRSQLKH